MTGATGTAIRRRLVVAGRVQGVGFRRFVLDAGRSRGLSGWVRNNRDGSVELEVEGPAPVVANFIDAVGRGPRGARVDQLTEREAGSDSLPRPFALRFED